MKQIKPVPYYTQCDDPMAKALAQELRTVFLPQIKKRFDMHHLSGFAHDAIVKYVAMWKKDYPYYLRTDIHKYYPSVHAVDLITQAQIAYRDLLGFRFVPRKFKDRFMKGMVAWMHALPVEQGIPLGSAVSAILAPLALVPLWLEIKRCYNVKLIVFMDDALILCKENYMPHAIWELVTNRLRNELKVSLNLDKTRSGRFAGDTVEFCGWAFAGGYVGITEKKQQEFKQRIAAIISHTGKNNTRAFIKCINHKIDGFGNYYKYGNVLRPFHDLDCFVRGQVRGWLCRGQRAKAYSNDDLLKLGLHSLTGFYAQAHPEEKQKVRQPTPPVNFYERKPPKIDFGTINAIAQNTETMSKQLQQLIALQRKQLIIFENMFTNLRD